MATYDRAYRQIPEVKERARERDRNRAPRDRQEYNKAYREAACNKERIDQSKKEWYERKKAERASSKLQTTEATENHKNAGDVTE